MKLVVKVGSQSILSSDGTLKKNVLSGLVAQLIELQKKHQVILVSSGAVGSGRKVLKQFNRLRLGQSTGEKQLLASLGQPELMRTYASFFAKNKVMVSQLLLTKQDFLTRSHRQNIVRLLTEILKYENVIPILNENDSVATQELMFTDNDELAGLIAKLVGADKLIILSNIDGVFSHSPEDSRAKLISCIDSPKAWPKVSASKSALGRGGMHSKLITARQVIRAGIDVHIANMREPRVLLRVVRGEALGTVIRKSKRK